jgi:hypothetical protein
MLWRLCMYGIRFTMFNLIIDLIILGMLFYVYMEANRSKQKIEFWKNKYECLKDAHEALKVKHEKDI